MDRQANQENMDREDCEREERIKKLQEEQERLKQLDKEHEQRVRDMERVKLRMEEELKRNQAIVDRYKKNRRNK